MNSILDTNNNPLTHVGISIAAGASWTFTVRVPCKAGMFLSAVARDKAIVSARRTGSGDAFQDLASMPLTLTEFDGSVVDFDIRVEAGDVPGLARIAIPVVVTFNP